MKVVQLELQLDQAESQIQKLLSQNEANWKDVAKIAIAVQKEKLFTQANLTSFTAWVNAIATKCDRSPSLIWRYIKAAKYYLHTVDSEEDDLEVLDEAIAPPEALDLLEKIERNAPQPVFEKLKEKVLEGEATVKECRQIEFEYRPEDEQLRRGRPAKGKEGTYEHLGKVERATPTLKTEAEAVTATATKIIEVDLSRNQIAATISRSLKYNLVDWTCSCAMMRYPPRHYKEHTEVRVNFERQRLRIDFLAVVRWSYKRPKDILAVEIKSCLQDFESDLKWENYLNFCHYFCFAIPRHDVNLKEAIESRTDAGILFVDFEAPIQENATYPIELYRQPTKLEGSLISLVYETLYERVLGWSGSDLNEDADEDADEDTDTDTDANADEFNDTPLQQESSVLHRRTAEPPGTPELVRVPAGGRRPATTTKWFSTIAIAETTTEAEAKDSHLNVSTENVSTIGISKNFYQEFQPSEISFSCIDSRAYLSIPKLKIKDKGVAKYSKQYREYDCIRSFQLYYFVSENSPKFWLARWVEVKIIPNEAKYIGEPYEIAFAIASTKKLLDDFSRKYIN
jgi:hypothetical protein